MFLFEAKNLSDLSIAEGRLPLSHLACYRSVGTVLLQELLGRHCGSNIVVGGIEDLEAKTILLDAKITDLTEITAVNVRPSVALSRLWLADVLGEVLLILVWLNDVANSQGVDVVVKATSKSASRALTAELGQCVGVHWIDIIVLLKRERVVVVVTLSETDSISCF